MESLIEKLDMLNLNDEKSILKSLEPGGINSFILETIILSCAIFKFNDYKKKQ